MTFTGSLPPAEPGVFSAAGPFYDTAARCFAALVAAFDSAGVLPHRQVMFDGKAEVELDERAGFDEMLAVEMRSVRTSTVVGVPRIEPVVAGSSFTLELGCWVLRDRPVSDSRGNAPSLAKTAAASQRIAADQWLLLSTLMAGIKDRTMFGYTEAVMTTCERWSKGGMAGSVALVLVGV